MEPTCPGWLYYQRGCHYLERTSSLGGGALIVAWSIAALALLLAGLLWRRERAAVRHVEALVRDQAAFATIKAQADAKTERLEATLSGMPDGIMMVGPDLRLLEWNALFAEFTGVPKEILRIGLPMEDILRAQATAGEFGNVDIDAEVKRRMALLQAGGSFGTIERMRPGGRTLELRRRPLAGGGFVTVYTDTTARHQAEDQLRQAQKMETIGHLVGGVAHDFNNLLMVVVGNLELAQRSLEAGNLLRAQRNIETSRGGAQRAMALVQRLVAFARRQVLQPQPVDANKLVSGMSELSGHSLGPGTVIETVLAGGLWLAAADPNQLEMAVLNLIINARDAMPEGGKITIETANAYLDDAYAADHTEVTAGQYVLVAVSDGGSGMTADEASRAFEPFFTTKPIGKGSGLGLSQVFGFVKQSHGHVKIYSEPGKGTTVKMYLPRLIAEALAEPERARPNRILPRANGDEAVLIVEDEPDILAYAVEVLEDLAYRVIDAKDASSALRALKVHSDIRLLITDIGLPDLSGQELADEAIRQRPNLAVLYISGYTPNAIVHREVLEGESNFLSKPFTISALAFSVRKAIDTNSDATPSAISRELN